MPIEYILRRRMAYLKLEFEPKYYLSGLYVISRLNHRVVSVSAAYSAVNSSANEEGLWFSQNDFGDASLVEA